MLEWLNHDPTALPKVPEAPDHSGRILASFILGFGGIGLMLAGIVAAFFNVTVAGWCIGLAILSAIIASVLLPAEKRRKSRG